MPDQYLTFEKPAEGLFRDRNSRFLAFAYPVQSVEQVTAIVASLKKKYHDARHHCYAYRIQPAKEIFRMNDDGEPQGTAGRPIYNQLVTNGLMNALIVVIRYFGGTLLGKGGLINAYKSAASDAISKAALVTRYVEDKYLLKFRYEKLNAVMRILKDENLIPYNARYESECSIIIQVRKSATDKIFGKFVLLDDVNVEKVQDD